MRDRVKFYGDGSSAVSIYSDRIKFVVEIFQINVEYCINDILEFYNILKFINMGIEPSFWEPDFINKYKKFGKDSKSVIGKFFSKVNDDNFIGLTEKVEIYHNEFWECIEQHEVYKKISSSTFDLVLSLNNIIFEDILHRKNIVLYYGESIRNHFLKNAMFAKILLDKYVIKHTGDMQEIFLPKQLTAEDKEKVILNYIDSDLVHINYLEAIINMSNNKEFKITAKTKLRANKKMEQEQTRMSVNGVSINYEVSVNFSKTQYEEKLFKFSGGKLEVSFSTRWIEENKDYETLLNNFIYLFEYTDMQMRVSLVSKESEMGVFEKLLLIKSNTDYPIGTVFKQKNNVAILEMVGYCSQLLRQNIFIEDVIEYFFKVYLKDEFSINDFSINLSRSDSYLDKCRSLFTELEAVLKQYTLYVEEGEIDKELLQLSDPLNYNNIPSIITKKCVYGIGNDYNTAKFYLTSDQCMLSRIDRMNFYELLNKKEVYKNDYDEFDYSEIDWLCEHEFIYIDDEGRIRWKDYNKVNLIVDLAKNEVLNYWHLEKDLRNTIDELQKLSMVEIKSSLFSIPEENYISFLLNKNKYGNGYDIRNKYAHGSQADNHEVSYMYGLMVFIIAIIKINDELCLKDLMEQE
ncbi:MAG: hypothetical protein F8N38_11485 [Hungatella sp.]|nr:hypothetical protein [Hungatella sp.]